MASEDYESENEPYNHMDEIVPGLWVGDLQSAKDVETLRANNIHSVLSAMRGRVGIHETFMRHQIMLDDTPDADILQHLIPAITFIQAEIEKGRGVLVHCQAGMSRSATIAAAYLMYSRNLDANSALELIKKARPNVQPNDGFSYQLEIFHQASYKVSRKDKATRMFYLERAVEEMMNGDGTAPETTMFAKFPRTPSDSTPGTPTVGSRQGPRRRIRCKMCRTELAAREHMLDHGQLGPPTPAHAAALSPVSSRRPSMKEESSRRPSMSLAMSSVSPMSAPVKDDGTGTGGMRPLAPLNPLSSASRRGSAVQSRRPSAGALGMTAMTPIAPPAGSTNHTTGGGAGLTRAKSLGSGSGGGGGAGSRRPSGLAFEGTGVSSGLAASRASSALEDEEDEELPVPVEGDGSQASKKTTRSGGGVGGSGVVQRRKSSGAGPGGEGRPRIGTGFFGAALSMSSAVESDDDEDVEMAPPGEAHPASRRNGEKGSGGVLGNGTGSLTSSSSTSTTRPDPPTPITVDTNTNASGAENGTSQSTSSTTVPAPPSSSTQQKANRPPSLPLPSPPALQSPADLAAQLYANPKLAALRSPTIGRAMSPGGGSGAREKERERVPVSPPILMNNKCSGYFVEPMNWMEFFLEDGNLAGKIICPNKKCGAKLGNYDWAGVCCSCKEWVTPGFCIHRSKVDEIIV